MDQSLPKQGRGNLSPLILPSLVAGANHPSGFFLSLLEVPSASDTARESLNTESPGAVLGEGAIYHLKGAPLLPLVMKLVPKHRSCLCSFRDIRRPHLFSLLLNTRSPPRFRVRMRTSLLLPLLYFSA